MILFVLCVQLKLHRTRQCFYLFYANTCTFYVNDIKIMAKSHFKYYNNNTTTLKLTTRDCSINFSGTGWVKSTSDVTALKYVDE